MLLLLILVSASSVYWFSVSGGIITGSELTSVVMGWSPAYYGMLWVARDSRRTGYWPAFHYGLWLWIFWYVAVPHYVLKTRGREGLGLALGLLLLLCAPTLSGFAGWWFYEDLPDFRGP